MELVVDANILLAALLKDAVTRELLVDSRLRLYAPEYLVSETLHHLKADADLRRRIPLQTAELQELFYQLTQEIETVPRKLYISQLAHALKIAPHRQDAHYLALALVFNMPVWSNDRGMCDQSEVKVYKTGEIIAMLGRRGN